MSLVPVTGSYRYKDIFQLLPPDKEAPTPHVVVGHYPLIIEYRFEKPETEYYPTWEEGLKEQFKDPIKDPMEFEITLLTTGQRKVNELTCLLSVLSNFRLFNYGAEQAWVIPMGDVYPTSDRKILMGQHFYSYPEFVSSISEFSMPDSTPMKYCEPRDYYRDHYFRPFDLPSCIDVLLTKYIRLNDEAKKAFDSSCILFCNAIDIWTQMASLSFAAFVSSLETLINYEHRNVTEKRCSECGQPQYQVRQKFLSFLHDFGSPEPTFKKYADEIYQYRSKILHSGKLLLADLERNMFSFSNEEHNEDMFRRQLINNTRICLVNWLMAQ